MSNYNLCIKPQKRPITNTKAIYTFFFKHAILLDND